MSGEFRGGHFLALFLGALLLAALSFATLLQGQSDSDLLMAVVLVSGSTSICTGVIGLLAWGSAIRATTAIGGSLIGGGIGVIGFFLAIDVGWRDLFFSSTGGPAHIPSMLVLVSGAAVVAGIAIIARGWFSTP